MPRAEPIQVEDIGMTYLVHTGKDFRRVKVTGQMVGHKYGEFVLTKKVRSLHRLDPMWPWLSAPLMFCSLAASDREGEEAAEEKAVRRRAAALDFFFVLCARALTADVCVLVRR